MAHITLTIDGVDYIAVPAAEYRGQPPGEPDPTQDAIAWTRWELARTLRRARETAELSQAALAKRLKRSQTLVARAESGDMKVSEAYVKSVLKACKLPKNWPVAV